jgi:hypothetical protein
MAPLTARLPGHRKADGPGAQHDHVGPPHCAHVVHWRRQRQRACHPDQVGVQGSEAAPLLRIDQLAALVEGASRHGGDLRGRVTQCGARAL